jgi:hypothetical protein
MRRKSFIVIIVAGVVPAFRIIQRETVRRRILTHRSRANARQVTALFANMEVWTELLENGDGVLAVFGCAIGP